MDHAFARQQQNKDSDVKLPPAARPQPTCPTGRRTSCGGHCTPTIYEQTSSRRVPSSAATSTLPSYRDVQLSDFVHRRPCGFYDQVREVSTVERRQENDEIMSGLHAALLFDCSLTMNVLEIS